MDPANFKMGWAYLTQTTRNTRIETRLNSRIDALIVPGVKLVETWGHLYQASIHVFVKKSTNRFAESSIFLGDPSKLHSCSALHYSSAAFLLGMRLCNSEDWGEVRYYLAVHLPANGNLPLLLTEPSIIHQLLRVIYTWPDSTNGRGGRIIFASRWHRFFRHAIQPTCGRVFVICTTSIKAEHSRESWKFL